MRGREHFGPPSRMRRPGQTPNLFADPTYYFAAPPNFCVISHHVDPFRSAASCEQMTPLSVKFRQGIPRRDTLDS